MARAKNTSRAEARRRTRETLRAEQLEDETIDEEVTAAEPVATPERPRMFRIPNFREDIRALPGIFMTRRLVWLPLLILLVGFGIVLVLPAMPASIASIGDLYLQFFFVPPALFTFFIAGYVAPRASYMIGFLYGAFASVLWSIVILGPGGGLTTTGTTTETASATTNPLLIVFNMLIIGALYGTLAGAFAAWYRDFLRGMRDRGQQRRSEQEAKERARRRDERQESRRVAKGRPTS